MGPDKAPGPDGITVRFLQQMWNTLGSDLTEQIKMCFMSQSAPKKWLRCRLILLSKKEDARSPLDYRPLSIGNVCYRLLMKLIANRLRQYMSDLIDETQTAYIQGRSITDNIHLVKEVMHSLTSLKYSEKVYLLKADIKKAFDTVKWQYLQDMLRYIQVPSNLINLIMNCLQGSEIRVDINQYIEGGGFIKPTRGLRQGCPLSPYLFVLAMEGLSRILRWQQTKGLLQGVKLAQHAPELTHALYADDVILFGYAKHNQIEALKQALNWFSQISGLQINPQKSKLWFSSMCTLEDKAYIKYAWQAKEGLPEDTYLGVSLSQPPSYNTVTHNKLQIQLNSKLNGWKRDMLSHAGQRILIQSTLTSTPVHLFSISLFNKKMIAMINSLNRRFFWGKTKDKFLHPVAWAKATKNIEEGGLGIKNVSQFNRALMLKSVWAIAANKPTLWVKVVRGKYCHQKGLWGTTQKRGTSQLWKDVQTLKHLIKDDVKWVVREGNNIPIKFQPWFEGWDRRNRKQSSDIPCISEVYCFNTKTWNQEIITQFLNKQQMNEIIQQGIEPTQRPGMTDKLIWTKSKDGEYSAKLGYEYLTSMTQTSITVAVPLHAKHWKRIWEHKLVIPRVKTFIWHAVHNGLITTDKLHLLFPAITNTCPRCGQFQETSMHLLFKCYFARGIWYTSILSLRTDNLPDNLNSTITLLHDCLDDYMYAYALNLMWQIWKARNLFLFQGKMMNNTDILQQNSLLTSLLKEGCKNQNPTKMRIIIQEVLVPSEAHVLLVDASWESSKKVGMACVAYNLQDVCIASVLQMAQADSAFTAEILAIIMAINFILTNPSLHGKACVRTEG